MKILITGKDKFTYNRTQVLLRGLEQTKGVELVYYPIATKKSFNTTEFSQLSQQADFVYIPPFRHSDVKFIKKYSKAPVVFDALISKYLTRTIDHGKWWTAIEKKWRDRVAFKHSDLIMMDTEAHAKYVMETYAFTKNKVISVPVGVDTSLFHPKHRDANKVYKVGFYGGFIPLQGVSKIVEAAHLLREHDIQFEIIGKGSEYKKVMRQVKKLKLNNIDFIGWVSYDQLNGLINGFDLCLGVFGDSLKADLVVPNKLYHYAALGKCIISKNTVGVREVFKDGENICLVSNDPESIANKILDIMGGREKADKIAEKGYHLIVHEYNQQAVAKQFLKRVTSKLEAQILLKK